MRFQHEPARQPALRLLEAFYRRYEHRVEERGAKAQANESDYYPEWREYLEH